MATLSSRSLFFTTSPRTPEKMIPEIKLLCENFSGNRWNVSTQEQYINLLVESEFFEGSGSPKNKAFSARDRINRAPKALGFVNLSPSVQVTDAGKKLIYGNRPQEVFLRQLLKFQIPSPYHNENNNIKGTFFIKPYLEIFRLIRDLSYLTFDEFKIYAINLTDYRNYDRTKKNILDFRKEKENNSGRYRSFVNEKWEESILVVYADDIESGRTQTRETRDRSLNRFVRTKKNNTRDYTDACFRYLRYTGLIAISYRNYSISIHPHKEVEVDYLLKTVDRNPVFIDDLDNFQAMLFNSESPTLHSDNKENLIESVLRISDYTRLQIADKSVDELKDIRDAIIAYKKEAVIKAQIAEIKSYALYSEIIDTYNEIISDEYYDAPLMFEYNTWRAMTMLNGGNIKGNFKFDDEGQPFSTAPGNMADIVCDYDDFVVAVEVTLQLGQRQYESEGEPVARHFGQLKKRTNKNTYCIFIAPTINHASLAHFYGINRIGISYYGGKSKIIPLDLDQFMMLVENSFNFHEQPSPHHIKDFLDGVLHEQEQSVDENDWSERIEKHVSTWLVAQ